MWKRYFILPKLTPEGYRVHLSVIVNGDPDTFDIAITIKRNTITEDVRYNTESFWLGDYLILDCKELTLKQLLRLTPTVARDFAYIMQNANPLMVKGIFLINSPSWVERGINIIKPFMNKKLLKRIHVFTAGPEALEEYIPRNMLPKDYGGEEETSEVIQDRWNQLFKEKRDWLLSEGQVTVDELKRVGDSREKSDLCNMQGSFKTLCLDRLTTKEL